MNFLQEHPLLVGVALLLLVLLLAVWAVASRYKIAKADEAYIITGRKGKSTRSSDGREVMDFSGQKVVIGGGVFVFPFIQQADKLSLQSRPIPLRIEDVLSQNNVLLNIDGVAMVKIGGTEGDVRAAAQRFLNQQGQIAAFAQETLAGSLRSIIGGMTVEQIIRDRATLASKVREEAEESLANQGLVVDTLQIQSVTDNNSYIRNLSRPEAARAEQAAKIAEASAKQAAAEKEAEAEQQIALAQKELSLRKAEIQAVTDQADANAAAAGPIAKAAQDQKVLEAEELVASRQAALTARELESEVNKPAEAAKFRRVQEAEADAASVKLAAEAELARRTAQANAVRAEGEAEAAAIRAKGEAEAAALLKKAEAYKQYNDAAVTQMLVDMLPKVAQQIAAPLASVKGMTIVSSDGASKLTSTTADILTQTVGVVKELTGVDLVEKLSQVSLPALGAPEAKEASPKAAAKAEDFYDYDSASGTYKNYGEPEAEEEAPEA